MISKVFFFGSCAFGYHDAELYKNRAIFILILLFKYKIQKKMMEIVGAYWAAHDKGKYRPNRLQMNARAMCVHNNYFDHRQFERRLSQMMLFEEGVNEITFIFEDWSQKWNREYRQPIWMKILESEWGNSENTCEHLCTRITQKEKRYSCCISHFVNTFVSFRFRINLVIFLFFWRRCVCAIFVKLIWSDTLTHLYTNCTQPSVSWMLSLGQCQEK